MIEFVPRRQLQDHLIAGWHLFPKVDYPPNEWAFLMWLGSRPTAKEVADIMSPYLARDARVMSNRRQGRNSGHPHG